MTPEIEQVLELLHARIAEEDAQRQTLSKVEFEARRPMIGFLYSNTVSIKLIKKI